MREYTGQTFTGRIQTQDRIPDVPLRFTKCVFDPASVMVAAEDVTRLRVRDVQLIGCQIFGGSLIGVILEEVVVDGLRVSSLPQIVGCLFRHVTLRGKIKQLLIQTDMAGVYDPAPFDAEVAGFYAGVDWALDISELDSPDFDLRGVPPRLVRYDPEYAVRVSLERAEAIGRERLRAIDYGTTGFDYQLGELFRDRPAEMLLTGPHSGKAGEQTRRVVAALREAGVAEPA